MSSKLVKKLLLQTTNNGSSMTSNNEGDYGSGSYQDRSRKRKYKSSSITNIPTTENGVVTKEEMVNEHVQSLLRLDNLSQQYSSGTAHKSFDRLSSNMKQQTKERKIASKSMVSNSRSNCSSFTQKPHESRFDKRRDKVEKEEKYYGDLARALRKASKKDKISSSSSNGKTKQK